MARITETSGHYTYAEAIAQAEDGREFTGRSDFHGLSDCRDSTSGAAAYARAERNALRKARRYEASRGA